MWIQIEFLIWTHPLTNFEIQKCYQNESRFNGVYFRDNLPGKIKDAPYIINLDDYSDIGTHWSVLYAFNNKVTYFDSFEVKHIPKEIEKIIGNKNKEKIFLEYKHIIQQCVDIFV